MRIAFSVLFFLWAAVEIVPQPDTVKQNSAQIASNYFSIYNEKTSFSHFYSWYLSNSFTVKYKLQDYLLFSSLNSDRFIVESRNSNNLIDADIQNKEESFSLGFETRFKSFFLRPQLIVAVANKKNLLDYTIDYGIYSSGLGFYLAQFSFRKTHFPFYAMGVYSGEGFGMTNFNPYYLISMKLGFNMHPSGSSFDISYSKNIQNDSRFDSAFGYTDKPEFETFSLTHTYNSEKLNIRSEFTRVTGKWRIILLNDNLPFSTMTFPTVSHSHLSTIVRLKESIFNPLYNFDYYYFRINGAGNVQSWPFTSIITRLVANRLNFRIEGSVNIINAGGKIRIRWGEYEFNPELQVFHIIPESEIDTWQPEYLVFGTRNYYNSYDEIKHIGLAKVTVSVDRKIEDFTIMGEISQYLPLYITKEVKKKRPPGYIKPEIGKATVSGGTNISLSIRKEF